MKELLIVKSGTSYLKFLPHGHQLTDLAKASVFPLNMENHVQDLMERASQEGAQQLQLRKLTITEEPYPRVA